ncbi:hypothetical protein [Acinetobacter brisouii]|nr:hypothetical protein [Acinetobacter brisouii]
MQNNPKTDPKTLATSDDVPVNTEYKKVNPPPQITKTQHTIRNLT